MCDDEHHYCSIIMAGGKGTRMGIPDKHKSTFEIGGKPSIYLLIDTLRQNHVDTNLLVVGALSHQIMEVMAKRYNDISFAFQPEQKGTGNAAKYGVAVLKSMGFSGGIFILAGDSFIEPMVFAKIIAEFEQSNADLVLMVNRKEASPTSGRVITNDAGDIIASIEYWDIQKPICAKKLKQIISQYNPQGNVDFSSLYDMLDEVLKSHLNTPKKIKQIFPEIYAILEQKIQPASLVESNMIYEKIKKVVEKLSTEINISGISYDPEKLESHAKFVNISVYLFRSTALYRHIDKILSENAQNEEYLTDIVQIFYENGHRVKMIELGSPNEVMAFNNPEELLAINDYYRKTYVKSSHVPSTQLKTRSIEKWISYFTEKHTEILQRFAEVYGTQYLNKSEKINEYLSALKGFQDKFSSTHEAFIVRVPGRLNLMGRHIDHRGGDVNMLAFDQELIFIASPREDDYIVAYNFDRDEFPGRSFCISEYLTKVEWTDWFQFISNKKINEMVRNSQGDWGNYIKAAALRLQFTSPTRRLKGMNLFIAGKIPQAAGLSSSSALVVGTLEALMAINSIPLVPQEFIDLCGEGEWFVGTRGGCSDHAAIKMSNFGKVTKIGFFPFQIKDSVPLPEECDVIIIDSQIKAKKSKEVLKKFNEKVFCYEIGFAIFKEMFPLFESKLHYLRDISPENLGITANQIYSMIKRIPIQLQIKNLPNYLHTAKIEELRKNFSLFANEDELPLRNILLYGITECARSRKALDLLKAQQIQEFGQVMAISHNGDRVVSFSSFEPGSIASNFTFEATDSFLDEMSAKNIPLEQVSGSYACSIPEIDFIIDFLQFQSSVFGAQLSGAGFGGCVMALVRKGTADALIDQLSKKFEDYWHMRLRGIITRPIQGASLF